MFESDKYGLECMMKVLNAKEKELEVVNAVRDVWEDTIAKSDYL